MECEGGEGVPLGGLGKPKNVKLPIVLGILHKKGICSSISGCHAIGQFPYDIPNLQRPFVGDHDMTINCKSSNPAGVLHLRDLVSLALNTVRVEWSIKPWHQTLWEMGVFVKTLSSDSVGLGGVVKPWWHCERCMQGSHLGASQGVQQHGCRCIEIAAIAQAQQATYVSTSCSAAAKHMIFGMTVVQHEVERCTTDAEHLQKQHSRWWGTCK